MGDIQTFAIQVDDQSQNLKALFPDGVVADRMLHFVVKLPQAPGEFHLFHGLYIN